MKYIFKKNNLYRNILIILIIFLSVTGLYFTHIIQDIIVPIIFALFTSFLLHPLVIKLNSIKIPYWLSILIIYFFYITIFIIVFFLITVSITNLLIDLPKLFDSLRLKFNSFENLFTKNEIIKKIISFHNIKNTDKTNNYITIDNISRYIIQPFNLILNISKSFVIYAVSLILILPSIDNMPNKILNAIHGDKGKKINKIIVEIIEKLQKYVFTKFIISLIIGLFSLIICFVFKIKYPFLWAFLIFILNFIPLIGTFIALTLTLLMHFIQYHSITYFILLYVSLMSIQIIMENVIQPHIISESVNLTPIVVIISIVFWVYLWGFSRILLAVPVTSAFNIIFQNINELKPISVFMSKKF